MSKRNQLGILLDRHLDAGFNVTIDDHVATMTYKGKVIGRYGINTTYEDIRHHADQRLEWERSGIKNSKEEAIHGNT